MYSTSKPHLSQIINSCSTAESSLMPNSTVLNNRLQMKGHLQRGCGLSCIPSQMTSGALQSTDRSWCVEQQSEHPISTHRRPSCLSPRNHLPPGASILAGPREMAVRSLPSLRMSEQRQPAEHPCAGPVSQLLKRCAE